jgi:uncharacterized protein (TIGR02246 family)
MRRLIFTASLLVSGFPLHAAETCVTPDAKAVAALFDDWNFALSSLDSKQVAQRYWPDAVLLPAASTSPRSDAAAISDYYTQFLARRPRGHVDTRTIQTGCNLAVDTGTYTFSLMDDKGTTTNESARYTFIYQYRDGAWKILNQQASAMPEASANTAPDAQLAATSPSNALASAKVAKADSGSPSPRKERRPRRKDYLDDVPAAKPVEKPMVTPVANARPGAEVKAPADAKATAEAKTPPDAKAAPIAKANPAATATSKPVAEAAPAAEAKLPPEVRTTMFANLTSSPPPSKFYPPEAMRHKERGSVNLKVCANGEGAVSDSVEVLKSSGSKLLDEAAMTRARAATWVPATYNRQRVEGCANVDVAFEPLPALADSRT